MSLIRTGAARRFAIATLIIAPLAPLAATPALAQDGQQDAQTMIVFESAGLSKMLVSEKDKALVNAIAMLPVKFAELRSSIGELDEIPEFMTDTAFMAVSSPWRMSMTNKGFDEQTGSPGVGIVLSWQMPADNGKAHADSMHQAISTIMAMAELPLPVGESDQFDGMSSFQVPFMFPVPVHFGPREAKDGWRYEFLLGAVDDPDMAFTGLRASNGINPVMHGRVDLAAFTPFVNMFAGMATMAGPQVATMIEQFRETGIIGEDAFTMDFTSGYKGDVSVGTMAMLGLGAERGKLMGLTDKTITNRDLKVIPQDATAFHMKKVDVRVIEIGRAHV